MRVLAILLSMSWRGAAFQVRRAALRRPALRALAAAPSATDLEVKIGAQGSKVKALKADAAADKAAVDAAVADLLALKREITELDPSHPLGLQEKKQKKKKKKAEAPAAAAAGVEASDRIVSRAEDFSQWYLDVIRAADMVDQSPVKGCMVIKPWGMAVWDLLREDVDRRIKATGTENAYFPLLIPQSFLAKEAQHVEGFAKECAVVTHHRLRDAPGGGVEPDPTAKLEEPLIVRPTSETIIWHMFGKWINSHRDLPLKINQWANVLRWEMRTRPFLRSAEFLWQEGHTAHASGPEAETFSRSILDMYADVARDVLAVPVVKGCKSATERFAGADETYTIEALMPNGWALQSGTSHFLGQNFARAFDVYFQSADNSRDLVWATSWGVSTRLLGALVMSHSDDAGLVLPPSIAPVQVVVVPVIPKKNDLEAVARVNAAVDDVAKRLRPLYRQGNLWWTVLWTKFVGLRTKVDDREHMRPGAKFFEWERKGVPLRIEVGPRDADAEACVVASRLGGDKASVKLADLEPRVGEMLAEIQTTLYDTALARQHEKTYDIATYDEMKAKMDVGDLGFFRVAWCADDANEEAIKTDCKATIRCYPLDAQDAVEGKSCFYSSKPATHIALFARAF